MQQRGADGRHAGGKDGRGFGFGPPSSGNRAFDEYRSETLRRLEDEQQEFKDFLQGLPAGVEFGEQATRGRAGSADGGAPEVEYAEGVDPESIELDKKIRAYMAAHKVTYAVAYAAVTK